MHCPLHARGSRFPVEGQRGFTLVELIMVIVILGIIGGVVAVFMQGPVNAYFGTARRAGLSDAADTAVQRISLDVRQALPNSIRVTGTQCVDLIPVKATGLYRANGAGALTFAAPAGAFNMLGANSAGIAVNDLVVLDNTGNTGQDAYGGQNVATISAVADAGVTPPETTLTLTPATRFPGPPASKDFQVVSGSARVVSYACTAQGTLVRAVNTSALAQNCLPGGGLAAGAVVNMLANNLTSCNFQYTSNPMNDGVLLVTMQMTNSTDSISLQHQVHMNNTP